MPFSNVTKNPQYDWISDGFNESLTSAFAQIGQFIVVERAQIDKVAGEQELQLSGSISEKQAVQIGKLLGAQKLVVGSFQILGGVINVNCRIVDVETGQIDRNGVIRNARDKLDNIFALQEKICLEQAQAFGALITDVEKERVAEVTTKSAVALSAYQFYVGGRRRYMTLTDAGYRDSVALFEKALEVEGGYALAFSGLAHSYAKLGWQEKQSGNAYEELFAKARQYGEKAVELAPRSFEAHRGLGNVYLNTSDFVLAQRELRDARRINGNDAETLYLYWMAKGRSLNDDLRAYVEKALRLNPGLLVGYLALASAYEDAGQYDHALVNYRKVLELNPRHARVFDSMGMIHLLMRDFARAQENFERAIEIDPEYEGYYYNMACLYSLRNEVEEAVRWLEESIRLGFRDFVWVGKDTDLDNIRQSEGFKRLMEQHSEN